MTDIRIPPKYNVAVVEALILEDAAELNPQNLTIRELSLRIIRDAADERERETATEAIRNLRDSGLLAERDGELIEPTPAALRAYGLLAG